MAKLSKVSLNRLNTCHPYLRMIVKDSIKVINNIKSLKVKDISIVWGQRSAEKQFEIFQKGRKFIRNEWRIIGKVATYCDGYNIVSNHQTNPSKPLSLAIDISIYNLIFNRIIWPQEDLNAYYEFAGIMKSCAYKKNINIEWGGDWKKKDYEHWQIDVKNNDIMGWFNEKLV